MVRLAVFAGLFSLALSSTAAVRADAVEPITFAQHAAAAANLSR